MSSFKPVPRPENLKAPLRVVAAAIFIQGNDQRHDLILSMPPPARHHNIMYAAANLGVDLTFVEESQGFLLSDGTFARRKPALEVARAAGQLLRETGPHIGLFSEDVW
jgi:hypothetical protein